MDYVLLQLRAKTDYFINLHEFQIDHLHDTLDDANSTMSENEKLFSDYRTTNIRQSMEIEDVSNLAMHE